MAYQSNEQDKFDVIFSGVLNSEKSRLEIENERDPPKS
jgi:hypothetical protein